MTNTNATGTDGPCVTCHMSTPNKHAFKSVSSANGAIAGITTTICTNCHTASMPAATLDAKRVEFTTALDILRIQLQDKGHTYSPNYPYFSKSNWGSGQVGANVMGAAFNYKLLLAEPGAYAHYPLYAKQLIVDSIDAAFNGGTVTGDIGPALNDLYGKGLITADQRTSLTTYKNPDSSCTGCHGNPPATTTHNNVTAGTCANCHVWTGPGGVTHNNGTVDVNLSCNGCHGNPPSSQTIHTTGFVKYTHSTPSISYDDCSACHETPPTTAATATHRDGTVEIKTNATACGSCHAYPPASAIHTAAIISPAPNCANCHTFTGYNGITHNDGTINVTSMTCNSCHGYPPAPRNTGVTFGVASSWVDARYEDYSGGGGAHVVAQHLSPNARASEGWANCAVCHNGGLTGSTPYHKMQTPVATHISNVHVEVDPMIRFAEGFTIYTGAKLLNPPARNVTGSCFNISCHMSPSQHWSTER